MFVFEALQAAHGDCFVLRWGSAGDKIGVIDGGPSGIYPILAHRLDELREDVADPLPIELMMVSHIDDDHINGLLALMRDLRDLKDGQKPLPYRLKKFWFNSFEDVAGAQASPATLATAAALAGTGPAIPGLNLVTEDQVLAVLSSVGQGRKLRDLLRFFHLDNNQPIGGMAMGSADPVAVAGLDIHLIGPLPGQIAKLQQEWQKAAQGQTAGLAAFLDSSAANLASIVCLAEHEGKRILLTGDARGDYVLEGLEAFGHLSPGGTLARELDLLKVPHHGSNRNVTQNFFERLPAKNYVMSGDGRHSNPDSKSLEWLIAARGDDAYTIHLTNELPWMAAFFAGQQPGRHFDVRYRDPQDDNAFLSIKL